MAQAGFTPISLYYSTTAAATPSAGNLVAGELALNTVDEKLYFKNSAGTVKLLASNATSAPVLSFQTSLGGLTPSTATTGVVTLAGTLNTTSGGTGLTSFTAGDVPYYAAGTLLSKLAIGTAGQILTSTGTAPQWSTLSGVAVTTFSAGTTGFTPSSATSGAVTLAGTLATANGGTNLGGATPFTSGGVVYASSSSALATGSALVFDGTNFGIGTTPNAWISSAIALQVKDAAFYSATNAAYISANEFTNTSSQNIYKNNGFATLYAQRSGNHEWYNAPSGIAGNVISLTQAMTLTAAGYLGISTASPTSMLQTAGSSSKSAFKTPNIAEVNTISATAATGTIAYDVTTQSVLYYTTNASGNFTVNFRGSSGTTLNTVMQTGESISATFLVTNGATAYYNSAVQVDGSSVTPKWQGGTAPTSGNASSIDSYTYVIIKTGSAAFTVLAAQTKFA